jgi:hypothetical protein
MTAECPCGDCDGAFLQLVSCKQCDHLFARCEETELLFPDPTVLDPEAVIKQPTVCPACGAALTIERAPSEIIQAVGLRWLLDYK